MSRTTGTSSVEQDVCSNAVSTQLDVVLLRVALSGFSAIVRPVTEGESMKSDTVRTMRLNLKIRWGTHALVCRNLEAQ